MPASFPRTFLSSLLNSVPRAHARARFLLLLAAPDIAASGQNSIVQIRDSSGLAVPYAVVDAGSLASRITDSLGILRLVNMEQATLQIRARRIGYAPFSGKVDRDTNGVYSVTLSRTATEIQGVRVVGNPLASPLARNGFYDRMQRVQNGAIVGEFITPEELDQRKPMQTSYALAGKRYVTVRREGSRSRATLAGRGSCAMTILVDGVRMNDVLEPGDERKRELLPPRYMGPDPYSKRLSVDELVEGGGVAAIEIYPSTANAPAELIPLTGGGSCGIIAIWTGVRR